MRPQNQNTSNHLANTITLGVGLLWGNTALPAEHRAGVPDHKEDLPVASQQSEETDHTSLPTIKPQYDSGLAFPQVKITGSFYASGLMVDPKADLELLSAKVINEIPELAQLSSDSFLSLSLGKQRELITKARVSAGILQQNDQVTKAEADSISSLITQLEVIDALINSERYQALSDKTQDDVLKLISIIGQRVQNQDNIVDLANTRGNAVVLGGWLNNVAYSIIEQGHLVAKDGNGTEALTHILRLLEKEESAEATMLCLDLVTDLLHPEKSSFQTSYPHCPSAGLHFYIINEKPGEYVRLVTELYSDGETRFSTGKVCKIDSEVVHEKHLKRRSSSASILQSSLIAYAAGADMSGRSEQDLQRGLNSEQIIKLLNDYFGDNFLPLSGTEAAQHLLQVEPDLMLFGAIAPFESTNRNNGHFVVLTDADEERLYLRDSNGSYGLHPHGWDIQKAASGEQPQWHWGDCSDAGQNPLPPGTVPMIYPARSGSSEIVFAHLDASDENSGQVPPPHFVREHPTRRMESWDSGLWSVEVSEFENTDLRLFMPESLLRKHFKQVEQPQGMSRKLRFVIGSGVALTMYYLGLAGYQRLRRGSKTAKTTETKTEN